jgi:hypothetical protein
MKLYRFFLLLALITGLIAASGPIAAKADMLKSASQIVRLYHENGNWTQRMPDGTIQSFSLSPGQVLIITGIYIRFYADTVNTGPYRFFLKAPNSTSLWIDNLNNILYPTTGTTVWGGGVVNTFEPGISVSAIPTMQVRQLLVPPNDPNTGPVIPGTFYGWLTGYVVPY